MSRPIKDDGGLYYFPVYTNIEDNPKIEFITAKHGLEGFAIYLKILIKIHKIGYFIRWTEKDELIYASKIGIEKKQLNSMMKDFLIEKLFNLNIFKNFSVITNKRVQRNYLEAWNRRTKIIMHKELCLIHRDDDEWTNKIELRPYISFNQNIISEKNFKYDRVIADNNTPENRVIVNNNTPTDGVIANNNTPTDGIIADNNISTDGVIADNNIPTDGVIADNNIPTDGVIADNNRVHNEINKISSDRHSYPIEINNDGDDFTYTFTYRNSHGSIID